MKTTLIDGEHYLCIIDELLSPKECKTLLSRSSELQWHHPGTGGKYLRSILIDRDLADLLYQRIEHLLPTTYDGHKLVYLNSHFRFSRYNTGGQFPIHYDGTNYDNDRHAEFGSTKSVFTLNIFLNDDFEGGHTIFYHDPSHIRFDAEPKVGRAALFYAQQPHCGTKVLSPYKYLLRTDVMGIME